MEVEHYDPYSDTWALTCPALRYVTNFTATACHGKLYLIGSCAVKYNVLTMQCYNPVIGEHCHTLHCSTKRCGAKHHGTTPRYVRRKVKYRL